MIVRLLLVVCAHAILIWLILAAWGRSSRKVYIWLMPPAAYQG